VTFRWRKSESKVSPTRGWSPPRAKRGQVYGAVRRSNVIERLYHVPRSQRTSEREKKNGNRARKTEEETKGRERASSRESNEQVARFPANDTDTTDHREAQRKLEGKRATRATRRTNMYVCHVCIYVARGEGEEEGRWNSGAFRSTLPYPPVPLYPPP